MNYVGRNGQLKQARSTQKDRIERIERGLLRVQQPSQLKSGQASFDDLERYGGAETHRHAQRWLESARHVLSELQSALEQIEAHSSPKLTSSVVPAKPQLHKLAQRVMDFVSHSSASFDGAMALHLVTNVKKIIRQRLQELVRVSSMKELNSRSTEKMLSGDYAELLRSNLRGYNPADKARQMGPPPSSSFGGFPDRNSATAFNPYSTAPAHANLSQQSIMTLQADAYTGTDTDSYDYEATRLAETVQALQQLFMDASRSVDEQGAVLDRIDFQVANFNQNTSKARTELHKVERRQRQGFAKQASLALLALNAFMAYSLNGMHRDYLDEEGKVRSRPESVRRHISGGSENGKTESRTQRVKKDANIDDADPGTDVLEWRSFEEDQSLSTHVGADSVRKAAEDAADEVARATEAALLAARLKVAPRNRFELAVAAAKAPETVVRYVADEQSPGFNKKCKERIVTVVQAQQDPLEPARFRKRAVTRVATDAMVPIERPPPRPLTVEERRAWDIPPCVSNWKNKHGYTIPLDIRVQADGRSSKVPRVNNDNFRDFANALYDAERSAREELALKSALNKEKKLSEENEREAQLRALAAEARRQKVEESDEGEDDGGDRRAQYLRRRELQREFRIQQAFARKKQSKGDDTEGK